MTAVSVTAVSVKRCVTGLQSQSRRLRLQSVTIKDAAPEPHFPPSGPSSPPAPSSPPPSSPPFSNWSSFSSPASSSPPPPPS